MKRIDPASGMTVRRGSVLLALALVPVLVFSGCGQKSDSGKAAPAAAHHHEHVAPHGGTAVVLGHEEHHLELVLDAAGGKMTAYVMDGELEQFLRVSAPSLRITASINGTEQVLELKAVANQATGERAGDTSQFEGTADWLKSNPRFDARLQELTVRGKTYRDVAFNFPKGNE